MKNIIFLVFFFLVVIGYIVMATLITSISSVSESDEDILMEQELLSGSESE